MANRVGGLALASRLRTPCAAWTSGGLFRLSPLRDGAENLPTLVRDLNRTTTKK